MHRPGGHVLCSFWGRRIRQRIDCGPYNCDVVPGPHCGSCWEELLDRSRGVPACICQGATMRLVLLLITRAQHGLERIPFSVVQIVRPRLGGMLVNPAFSCIALTLIWPAKLFGNLQWPSDIPARVAVAGLEILLG